jgi:dienelactone hydrolase
MGCHCVPGLRRGGSVALHCHCGLDPQSIGDQALLPLRGGCRIKSGMTAILLGTASVAHADQVTFPSLDSTPLKAEVFLPSTPPKGIVIALHGCGGLYARQGQRKGLLNARHQAMADMLVAQGYAAVFPDSLSPRGEAEICTQRFDSRRIGQPQRRADALAAVRWAMAQPWGGQLRVALLGWSHGGSAVLASTDANQRQVQAQPVKPVVAIAFYPGCSASLKNGYQPSTKLVMLVGEKDDWTPAAPCVALAKATNTEITVYPDSYHDFDNPVGTVRIRLDVPNGVNPGQGVHTGPNPVAREQANARVREVLAEAFK